MDFLATHPNAKLQFFAGIMQLTVDSDTAYLVLPRAKNQIVGHFYLTSLTNMLNYTDAPNNAPILTEYKTLKHVVCSASEVECAGIFHNGQIAIATQNMLNKMGHQQQPTQIKTENKTTTFLSMNLYQFQMHLL
eukprot:3342762-Ditylum_brightwellii.AAC.1